MNSKVVVQGGICGFETQIVARCEDGMNVEFVFDTPCTRSRIMRRRCRSMALSKRISGQRSKHVNELLDIDFDYVVTMCDNAREQCPLSPGKKTIMVHIPFEDPACATGTDEEIMAVFRKCAGHH